MDRKPSNRSAPLALALAGAMLLGACATPPVARGYPSRVPQAASPPPPPAIYPTRGQSERQLQRDRYECYQWAVAQSGHDPALQLARSVGTREYTVVDPAQGAGTATGVVAGAILGTALSGSHHNAEGAAIGALIGGIVGAASDAARATEARRLEQALEQRDRTTAQLDGPAAAYLRALGACLEGRGYRVR